VVKAGGTWLIRDDGTASTASAQHKRRFYRERHCKKRLDIDAAGGVLLG
jgi:hypothetical protein